MLSKFDKENDDYGLIGNILFGGKNLKQIPDALKDALSSLQTIDFSDANYWNDDTIHKYAEELGITNEAYEKLIKNMRDGKITINSSDDAMKAYDKTVKQINTTTTLATAGAQAMNIAMKALSTIGWMLVITLITEAFGSLAEKIDEAIVTSEEAREKSRELTQTWKEENDVIDESSSKYKQLSEILKDTSLSESEVLNIKKDLASVQDTLKEKFKNEIKDIDLVNGKYEEQLTTLKELSKEKARDYIRKNKTNINSDKDYLNKKLNWTNNSTAIGAQNSVGYKYSGKSIADFIDYAISGGLQ